MRNVLSFHRERPYEWKPGVHTLIYYDFETASGTNVPNLGTLGSSYNGVATGVTFSSLTSGKKIATIASSAKANGIVSDSTTTLPNNFTIWAWIKSNGTQSSRRGIFGIDNGQTSGASYAKIEFNADNGATNLACYNNAWVVYGQSSTATLDGSWHLVCYTYGGQNLLYKDATALTVTFPNGDISTQPAATGYVSVGHTGYAPNDRSFDGSVGVFGIEDRARTADEIAKYYNRSKDNYESTPHIPVYDNLLETKDASNWITSSVNYDRYLGAQFDYVSPITTSYKIVIERVGGSLVAVSPTSQSDSSQYSTSDEGIVSVESGNHPVIYTYFPPRSTGGYIAYLYGDSAA